MCCIGMQSMLKPFPSRRNPTHTWLKVMSISSLPLPEGAWAPEATYNATDIATVFQYALYRGIRVIPEFDTPGRLALIPAGHVGSWGKGYPSITTDCPKYSANVDNINLNPASNLTLQVVTGRASTLISRPLFRDVSCLSR